MTQFFVDCNPQCLKDQRCGMPARFSGSLLRPGNEFRQLSSGFNSIAASPLNDGAGNPAAVRLFAVFTEDACQLVFRFGRQ